MNKNGFTLIEILAVIVITALITIIASAGISGIKNSINERLYASNVSLIERSATNFGEDKKSYLTSLSDTCTINGKEYKPCLKVSVQSLIDKYYVKSKVVNDDNEKVLIDYRKNKGDENYYMNNTYVYIFIDDYVVYAKYIENGEI